MDLTKLGNSSWSNSNNVSQIQIRAVDGFQSDLKDNKVSSSIDNHFNVIRSKKDRSIIDNQAKMNSSLSSTTLPMVNVKTNTIQMKGNGKQRYPPTIAKTLDFSSIHEHPPTRSEIKLIEKEFDDQVREITHPEDTNLEALDHSYYYQPYKDILLSIRNKHLHKYNISYDQLRYEPWLELLIKCDCLKTICDDTSEKLVDMLNVLSLEIGNILRKVRQTYKNSFNELLVSWDELRNVYKSTDIELNLKVNQVKQLQIEIESKENELKKIHDNEMKEQINHFEIERKSYQDTIKSQQDKIDQLSETLRIFNGLLKTIQQSNGKHDSLNILSLGNSSGISNDITIEDYKDKIKKLEYDNNELYQRVIKTDQLEYQNRQLNEQIIHKENNIKSNIQEINHLKSQIKQRDDGIALLIEKDLLKTAEIEKLQIKLNKRDLFDVNPNESNNQSSRGMSNELMNNYPSSVLCVRCKKSLDDISNLTRITIEEEINSNPNHRLKCESFRLLLPNIKGRHPERSIGWLRRCIRSILLSKMNQDVNIYAFNQLDHIRIPQYVYSWFERNDMNLQGMELTKQLILNDDDRWAFYYGVRALSRDNDPECMIMWSLLDEYFKEDGSQFISFCLSVILSISGREIWEQFHTCAIMNTNITMTMKACGQNETINRYIWVDVNVAKEATRLILHRAMESHINEVIEAIDAFTVIPYVETDDQQQNWSLIDMKNQLNNNQEELKEFKNPSQSGDSIKKIKTSKSPTHVNLFLWLRLMLKQLQAEQIQRKAAIQLMFETASIGALTQPPPNHIQSNYPSEEFDKNGHVEFPQFQSICRALFQNISTTDTALLYTMCYYYSSHHQQNQSKIDIDRKQTNESLPKPAPLQRRVTAEVFLEVADIKGLFSKYMNFVSLPLFSHHNLFNDEFAKYRETLDEERKAEDNQKQAIQSMLLGSDSVGQLNQSSQKYGYSVAKNKGNYTELLDDQGHPVVRYNKLSKENVLRANIGSMIHRKFAIIKPDILLLVEQLPEKWSKMLRDCMDSLAKAIDESYVRQRPPSSNPKDLKSRKLIASAVIASLIVSIPSVDGAIITGLNKSAPIVRYHSYIDGFQPYVHYRRLLALTSFVQALTDNPLLPPSIFTTKITNSTSKKTTTITPQTESLVTNLPLDIGMKRAERALASLEESIVIESTAIKSQVDASEGTAEITPYISYHQLLRKISARRIAKFIHQFVNYDVPVPRSVRYYMRPGYLRGVNTSLSSSLIKKEAFPVYTREVLHEPWWAEAMISNIYQFKCKYDMKAANMLLNPIPLSQAIVAYFYIHSGSAEVAERLTHDLMFAVKTYKWEITRIRLFSALIGDNCNDIDDITTFALKSSHAWAVYLSLLKVIREEVYYASKNRPTRQAITHDTTTTADAKQGVIFDDDEKMMEMSASHHASFVGLNHHGQSNLESARQSSARDFDVPSMMALNENYRSPYNTKTSTHAINNLFFVSSDNCLNRSDAKDVWTENIDLVIRAVSRWSKQQQYLKEDHQTIFTDVLLQLTIHDDDHSRSTSQTKDQSRMTLASPKRVASHTQTRVDHKYESLLHYTKEVEVDDALWLVMLQWAKLMSSYSNRGQSRANSIEKVLKHQTEESSYHKVPKQYKLRSLKRLSYESLIDILESAIGADDHNHQFDLLLQNQFAKANGKGVDSASHSLNGDTTTTDPDYLLTHQLTNLSSFYQEERCMQKLSQSLLTESILWDLHLHPVDSKEIMTTITATALSANLTCSSSPIFEILAVKKLVESYWMGFKQFIVDAENVIRNIEDENGNLADKVALLKRHIDDLQSIHNYQDSINGGSVIVAENLFASFGSMASEIRSLLKITIKTIDHLSVLLQLPFPMDSWKGGKRVYVERSPAFSAIIRNNL